MTMHPHADGTVRYAGQAAVPSVVYPHCLHCEYNLTGTVEPRCPECGEPFDRAWLEDWFAGRDPEPFGALQLGMHWEGVWLRMSLLEPARLARLLSPGVRVAAFWLHVEGIRLLAAVLVPLLLVLPAGSEWGIFPVVTIGVAACLSSLICEGLLSLALGILVSPIGVEPRRRFAFWFCLARCFVPHLAFTIALMLLSVCYAFSPDALAAWLLPCVPPLVWWWFCLGRAVARRGADDAGRLVAILAIPVVGVVSVVIGGFITFLFAIVVLR